MLEQLEIGVKRARVALIVLVWPKLCGVYEDGNDNNIAGNTGGLDERNMPGVQGSHRGDQANRALSLRESRYFFHRVD